MKSIAGPEQEAISVADLRGAFADIMNRVLTDEVRVVIESEGVELGALVSPKDFAQLQVRDRRRSEAWQAILDAQSSFADEPEEVIEREIEKAIAEVKAERRAAREEGRQFLEQLRDVFGALPPEDLERKVRWAARLIDPSS